MDASTLAWIAANPPPPAPHEPLLVAEDPLLLVPHPAWFADPHLADSLHGIQHGARVSVLACLLAREHGLDREHTAALCTAATVHDCRRHNDRADPGHGQRAGSWFAEHADTVLAAFGQDLSQSARAEAATAIAVHDLPYDAFPSEHRAAYQRAPHLADLLKAADTLDRYRLPLQRWWPDASHLRIAVPDWLYPIAHRLVVRSEQARLTGADHHSALTHALTTLFAGDTRA
ncbi:hypothetical protein CTZ27_29690 [Streptomyces griseocarneus]|nr:hypothetical protein CTZ27_29690 [Streptomyces griseocarneus]